MITLSIYKLQDTDTGDADFLALRYRQRQDSALRCEFVLNKTDPALYSPALEALRSTLHYNRDHTLHVDRQTLTFSLQCLEATTTRPMAVTERIGFEEYFQGYAQTLCDAFNDWLRTSPDSMTPLFIEQITPTSMLSTLREHACGRLEHVNNGDCPDEIAGYCSRDTQCPVCQMIMASELIEQMRSTNPGDRIHV